MFKYRESPSAQRAQSHPYYAGGSPRQWIRRAVAAIDEAAAALCREQWQLAPVRVVAPESRAAIAARLYAARLGRRVGHGSSWR
jgi:hypothetical protein